MTVTCSACELGDYIKNQYGHPIDLDFRLHKGFTIGAGKKLYWYFIWHPSGNATVYDSPPRNKRYIKGDQLITVHFNPPPTTDNQLLEKFE
jgi:hypothetical protein